MTFLKLTLDIMAKKNILGFRKKNPRIFGFWMVILGFWVWWQILHPRN